MGSEFGANARVDLSWVLQCTQYSCWKVNIKKFASNFGKGRHSPTHEAV